MWLLHCRCLELRFFFFYKNGRKKFILIEFDSASKHGQTEIQEGDEENLNISQSLEMAGLRLQLFHKYRDH